MPIVFAPGELPEQCVPGDFGLLYSRSALGRLIRFREWVNASSDRRYAWASHAFLVTGADGTIIEALAGGLKRDNIEKYRGQAFALVPPFASDSPQRTVGLAWCATEFKRHPKYGWLDAVSVALGLLPPDKLDMNWNGSMICSAWVARYLEHGGYNLPGPSPFSTTPAQLASWWEVLDPRK